MMNRKKNIERIANPLAVRVWANDISIVLGMEVYQVHTTTPWSQAKMASS